MSSASFAGLPSYLHPEDAYLSQSSAAASSVLNAVLTITVPGHVWQRVLSISLVYQSSNAVAVRIPTVQILDQSGNIVIQLPAVAGQDASFTSSYYWFPNAGGTIGVKNGNQVGPWPDVWLSSGWQVRAFGGTAQANDTIGPLVVYGEFVPTGSARPPSPVLVATPLAL